MATPIFWAGHKTEISNFVEYRHMGHVYMFFLTPEIDSPTYFKATMHGFPKIGHAHFFGKPKN